MGYAKTAVDTPCPFVKRVLSGSPALAGRSSAGLLAPVPLTAGVFPCAYLQEVSGADAGRYSPVLKLLLRLCQLPFLIPFQVFTPLTFQEKNLKSYILTIIFILFLF